MISTLTSERAVWGQAAHRAAFGARAVTAGARGHSPVSEGRDKVEAAVHPVVHDVPPVQAALVVQVPLKLLVDVGDDRLETGRDTDAKGHGTPRQAGPNFEDKMSLPSLTPYQIQAENSSVEGKGAPGLQHGCLETGKHNGPPSAGVKSLKGTGHGEPEMTK